MANAINDNWDERDAEEWEHFHNLMDRECHYCGKMRLHWRINPHTGKWRLYNQGGTIHVCKAYRR